MGGNGWNRVKAPLAAFAATSAGPASPDAGSESALYKGPISHARALLDFWDFCLGLGIRCKLTRFPSLPLLPTNLGS
jgi:hypothetical protein